MIFIHRNGDAADAFPTTSLTASLNSCENGKKSFFVVSKSHTGTETNNELFSHCNICEYRT